jgi:hypothetical protein
MHALGEIVSFLCVFFFHVSNNQEFENIGFSAKTFAEGYFATPKEMEKLLEKWRNTKRPQN